MRHHTYYQRYNKITGFVGKVYEGSDTEFEDKDLLSGKYVYTVTAVVDKMMQMQIFTVIL